MELETVICKTVRDRKCPTKISSAFVDKQPSYMYLNIMEIPEYRVENDQQVFITGDY
jgi:hypothetical protein